MFLTLYNTVNGNIFLREYFSIYRAVNSNIVCSNVAHFYISSSTTVNLQQELQQKFE